MGKSLAKEIFNNYVENSNVQLVPPDQIVRDGVITSIDEFLTTLITANDIYNTTFTIADNKKIIFAEDFPKEQLVKLNNESNSSNLSENSLRDIRVITYTATEEPGIISAHALGENGIRSIKNKFAGIYEDPDYTGYSVLRSTKDITVNLTFKVWGVNFQDIRQRSKLLRDVIDSSMWYFLQKGLRTLAWTGSIEEELWDAKNIAKYKLEKYQLRLTEVKDLREKNLEQIVIQAGLSEL